MSNPTDWLEEDYTALAENEERWAEAREVRKACDPRKGLADTICPACKGSGLDPHDTQFTWDEFNPEGYWETEPCEACHGTGLSKQIQDSLESGEFDGRLLLELRWDYARALGMLQNARKVIKGLPSLEKSPRAADRQLGALEDELDALLGELDPEG